MLHLQIIGYKPKKVFPFKFNFQQNVFDNIPKPSLREQLKTRFRQGLARSGIRKQESFDHGTNVPPPPLSHISENTQSSVECNSDTETSSASCISSLSDFNSHGTLSASNCWASGISTERSSVDSSYLWEDDDYYKQATRNVVQLFDEIDAYLYGEVVNSRTKDSHILGECQQWQLQFPHLRVLGKQIYAPKECGFSLMMRESSDDFTKHQDLTGQSGETHGLSSSNMLSVEGHAIHGSFPPPSLPKELSYLNEEIIVKDGEYEEIIAIDFSDKFLSKATGEVKKSFNTRGERKGYPPVTPSACLHDAVISCIFDYVWQEMIEVTGSLTKMYTDYILNKKMDVMTLMDGDLDFDPVSHHALLSNKISSSNINDFNFERKATQLDDLLTVSRKELILREKSSLHDSTDMLSTPEAQSSFQPLPLPSKSRSLIQANTSQRDVPDNILSQVISRRGGHVTQRAVSGVRLTPLTQPHVLDRSRTPSIDDTRSLHMQNEVLVGHRLTRTPEVGLTSPPLGYSKHTTLPALDVSKRNVNHTRATSALPVEKEVRLSYKERYLQLQEPIHRPNTTQAFRSETPLIGAVVNRRSSTPQGPLATLSASTIHNRNRSLGVTGSSLQVDTSASVADNEASADHPSAIDLPRPQQHWTPMAASHRSSRYARGKHLTSFLRV